MIFTRDTIDFNYPRYEKVMNGENIIKSLKVLNDLQNNQKPYVVISEDKQHHYFQISAGNNTYTTLHLQVDNSFYGAGYIPLSLKKGWVATINLAADCIGSIPTVSLVKQSVSRNIVNMTSSLTGSKATFLAVYEHLNSLIKDTRALVKENRKILIPQYGCQITKHKLEYRKLLLRIAEAWKNACGKLEILKSTYLSENDTVAADSIQNAIQKVTIERNGFNFLTLLQTLEAEAQKILKPNYHLFFDDGQFNDFKETFADLIPDPNSKPEEKEKNCSIAFSNIDKNINPRILPNDANLFGVEQDSSYVNASKVFDGFAIAIQNPEKSDRASFWKLIWNSNSKMGVCLDEQFDAMNLFSGIGQSKNEGFSSSQSIEVTFDDPYIHHDSSHIAYHLVLRSQNQTKNFTLFILRQFLVSIEGDLFVSMSFTRLITALLAFCYKMHIDWNEFPLLVYSDFNECRSAVFLAILRSLRRIQEESLDFKTNVLHQSFDELRDIRKGRSIAISEEQYKKAFHLFKDCALWNHAEK